MKINMRKEKGITSVDLGIAMGVAVIFVVIMTSVSYSVFLSETEARRTAVALNYAVDIFENIGSLDFSDVNVSSGKIFSTSQLSEFELESANSGSERETITGKIGTYEVILSIENYRNSNVVKIIYLSISYPISKNNSDRVELQRIKKIT